MKDNNQNNHTKEIFKRLVSGDFRGLDFLKKFKPIDQSYQKSSLTELKTKGLKHSLADALERKDYVLAEAINAKIKEIQEANA